MVGQGPTVLEVGAGGGHTVSLDYHFSSFLPPSTDFYIYDGPNGSLFISILLHNSEFRILNSEICTANFEIRNCEVHQVWASGNS